MQRLKSRAPLAFILVLALGAMAAESFAGPAQGRPGSSQSRSSGLTEFPFKWWQNDRFKAELGLTAEQISRIDDIFQSTLPGLRSCYRELERLEDRMNDAISAGNITEVELIKQIDAVEAARSELSKTRTLMLFRMRQVLTPEQRVKMKKMHEEWERERRRSSR